ncbi:hypothetical protein J437_LFUL017040 [Ladona fulva]|uniref:Cysteine proteinase n=1 Tax=Ladona fulva TaxID=123851 RepID=A0A8K0P998_LADFU|nr:hypothetical protein J437_LFUL017040 [Ladona fulva]
MRKKVRTRHSIKTHAEKSRSPPVSLFPSVSRHCFVWVGGKMATALRYVLCILAFNYAHSLADDYKKIDNPDHEIEHLKQFVLETFNTNKDTVYDYNEAHILDAQKRDGPERNYYMLLDIDVSCRKDSVCSAKSLVCEVFVKEDTSSEKKEILEDNSVCVKKLPPSPSVINKDGFVEGKVSEEVQRVAELAVEQLENEGDTKRTIFDIMSVKTQDNAAGKKLFLTLKVAKPLDDAVDVTEFETCEIEVSMNDPLVVENSTSCFPISEGHTDYSMSEDDMNEEAKKALKEINSLSNSPFKHVLTKVITAVRSVTPGSQGSVTTLVFQVAPSLCLKNGGGERENLAERICPPMTSSESQTPLQCIEEVSEEEVSSKSVFDVAEDAATTVEPPVEKEETYCTGCLTDLDAESDNVRSLAQEVLTSMETPFAHRLVRVVKAQKQVINGVRYVMTLEVVRTACPPEAARIDLNGCPEIDGEEDGGVRTCHIEVIERPWTDSAREVVANDCSGESPATRKDASNVQASVDSTSIPHEETDLNEVVQAFDELFGDDPQVVVPEVQFYDGTSDFVGSSNDVPVITVLHRERRETRPLAGGISDADPSDPYIQSIAGFALSHLTSVSDGNYKKALVRITKAQKQIVSGLLVYLTMEIGDSQCEKDTPVEGDCTLQDDAPTQVCTVEIWDRAWLKQRQIKKASCEDKSAGVRERRAAALSDGHPDPLTTVMGRSRRDLVGGLRDVTNSPEHKKQIQQYSRLALDSMDNIDEDSNKRILEEVISAKVQIVQGYKYHLVLKISTSNCDESQSHADCTGQGSSKRYYQCEAQVHVPASKTEHPRLVYSTCKPFSGSSSRTRRSVPGQSFEDQPVGGLMHKDVNDPDIQRAANVVVAHLTSQSSGSYKKTLVRVLSAQTQVVEGHKYYLTIEVGNSLCQKDVKDNKNCGLPDNSSSDVCQIELWERPWLNKSEVLTVSCNKKEKTTRKKREFRMDPEELNQQLFDTFKRTYNKTYSSQEEHRLRYRIFRANLKKIKVLQETEQGTGIYGATQFTDLTVKEFKKLYLGYNPHARKLDMQMKMAEIPDVKLPLEFDWRDYNVVTEVKNQGMCGSCWAFSVTGNVEGQYALHHKKLISLSEQELVDCDTLDQGCNGGLMDQAYHAIENIGGLEDEHDYPYEGDKETCHFKESEAKVTLTGSLNISSSEDDMAKWLFKNGPISIALNANAMQFYFGGISHPWKLLCDPEDLDHGVLIVGFGVHNYPLFNKTMPYWIIKNSWGIKWGEQGYYRIYRGDGTCGVNRMASSAIVA